MTFRRLRRPSRPRSALRRFFDLALTVVLFGLMVLVIVRLEQFSTRQTAGAPGVADGDTLVFDGRKVRLEGIDAPEFTQMCQSATGQYACGRESRGHLVRLIGTSKVKCEGWQLDKYQRLLVHCTVGNFDINRDMVLQGWAVAYGDYETEEAQARKAMRGVWQGTFERPSVFRRMKGELVDIAETPHDLWFMLRQIVARLFGPSAGG